MTLRTTNWGSLESWIVLCSIRASRASAGFLREVETRGGSAARSRLTLCGTALANLLQRDATAPRRRRQPPVIMNTSCPHLRNESREVNGIKTFILHMNIYANIFFCTS